MNAVSSKIIASILPEYSKVSTRFTRPNNQRSPNQSVIVAIPNVHHSLGLPPFQQDNIKRWQIRFMGLLQYDLKVTPQQYSTCRHFLKSLCEAQSGNLGPTFKELSFEEIKRIESISSTFALRSTQSTQNTQAGPEASRPRSNFSDFGNLNKPKKPTTLFSDFRNLRYPKKPTTLHGVPKVVH